jgi:quercetin dioxygenase-like cupin family protein
MIGIHSNDGYTDILPGIKIKTLCYGESTLLSEFVLAKGAALPPHSHPNEQTGYLVRGKMRLIIDEKPRELNPGDSWSIKADCTHRAEIIEDSVAVEVFHPVRKDYIRYLQESQTERENA